MKNLIKILLILSIVYSCKKDKPIETEKTITLTGKIVLNCAGDPMANQDIELWITYGVWDKDNTYLNVKTDSNGNFSWTFEIKKPCNLSIRPGGGADILEFDSSDPENLGTIIATPKCNVVMKIKVNNPYSLGDTLQLKDFVNHPLKGLKLSGPFRDTILPVAYNYSELQWPGTFEEKNTTFASTYIYIYISRS